MFRLRSLMSNLLSITYLISSVIGIVVLSLLMLHINRGARLTPFFITGLNIFVMILISIPLYRFGIRKSLEYQRLIDEHLFSLFWVGLLSTLVFFLGAFFCQKILEKFSDLKFRNFFKIKKIESLDRSYFYLGLISFVVFVAYVLLWDYVPLIEAFRGHDLTLPQIRSKGLSSLPTKSWVYKIVLINLFPFLSWYFLLRFFKNKKNIELFITFIVFFILSLISSFLSLQKAPALLYCAFTGLVLLRGEIIKVSKKIIFLGLALFLSYLVLSNMFLAETGAGIVQNLLLALNRIFSGQSYASLFYFDFFANKHDLLLGSGFPNPAGVFPYEVYNYTYEIWNFYFGYLKEIGLVGNIPTFYILQWYINFHILGVVVGAFLTGSIVYLVSDIIEKIEIRELKVPISALVSVVLMKIATTDVTHFILNFELHFAVLIILIVFVRFKLMEDRAN